MNSLRLLGRYLSRFLEEWLLTAITVVDIAVLLFTLFLPTDYLLSVYVRPLTIVIAVGAFFLANLRIYAELEPKANIRLALTDNNRVSYPDARKKKGPTDEDHPHLGKSALPSRAHVYLDLEAINTGSEDGELVCWIDMPKSKLPHQFAFAYETWQRSRVSVTVPSAPGRKNVNLLCSFVITGPHFSHDFAQTLKSLTQGDYFIVVQYHTEHTIGSSNQGTIIAKIDFGFFCKALIYDWKQYGFDQLVEIYELAD